MIGPKTRRAMLTALATIPAIAATSMAAALPRPSAEDDIAPGDVVTAIHKTLGYNAAGPQLMTVQEVSGVLVRCLWFDGSIPKVAVLSRYHYVFQKWNRDGTPV